MQQTEKYKFKLIETSDPFSPDAINDHAQQLESALLKHETAVDAALTQHKTETDTRLFQQDAQIVQAREENAMISLGEAMKDSDGFTFDLSGVDMDRFAVLLLFVAGRGDAAVRINKLEVTTMGSYPNYTGGGVVRLVRTGSGIDTSSVFSYVTDFPEATGNHATFTKVAWTNVKSVTVSPVASYARLYGLKK